MSLVEFELRPVAEVEPWGVSRTCLFIGSG